MSYRLDYRRYRVAFKGAVRVGGGVRGEREGLIVRVEGERVGWGEVAPIEEFGTESVDEAEAACRALGGRVGEIPEELGCLRFGVGAAVAECAGSGVGGREFLPVAALVPAGRGAPGVVAQRGEAGFRTFKWKVGAEDAREELAMLGDVCAALPPGGRLRLDANGAWDRREAERWLDRCSECPVEFVEQPVPAGEEDILRGLAEDYPTPIALDESLARDGDAVRWLDAGWQGVFVIKPCLHGDLAGVLARLEAGRAEVVFSSALETAVGAKAALRAAFAWRGEPRALGFGVWPLFASGVFDGPAAAPFLRREDVERIDPETVWNALT